MNIFYCLGLDASNPTGLHYDGSLQRYQGSGGLCSPVSANPLVSSTPVIATPYVPPAGGRSMDLVVAPTSVVSLLAPQVQSTNFCASSTYRMKTPYMMWPKLLRSRDRVDKSVRCELCDMVLNSEQQAKQHFNGKHHLRKMRKLKLNSSTAAEEKSPTDLKRSSCKADSTGKKTRTKKRYINRNDEDTKEIRDNGDPVPPDEESESRDEEMTNCGESQDGTTDTEHLQLSEQCAESLKDRKDRTLSVKFDILKTADSADKHSLDLDETNNADSPEELILASNALSGSSNPLSNEFSSVPSQANCALVQNSSQAASSYLSLSSTASDRCSWTSCYSSPLLHDVLSHSSLQSSQLSSASSSLKIATGHSMTTSRDNDTISIFVTPFLPGSLLPRP